MQREAEQIGVPLDGAQAAALMRLAAAVSAAPFNVTAIRDAGDVRRKHLLDSLSCLRVMRPACGERLLDIGSGGGFPGLPLAILRPDTEVHLLEANRRKGTFLADAASALGLANVAVIPDRAETVAHLPRYREQFEWVVARAVAPLRVLLEYGLPFCRAGGCLVAMKGPRVDEEIAAAGRALGVLGGRWGARADLVLPGGDERRSLVCAVRVHDAPRRYPRSPGVPSRRPL